MVVEQRPYAKYARSSADARQRGPLSPPTEARAEGVGGVRCEIAFQQATRPFRPMKFPG
jgi:hypothetical protein